MDKLTEDLNKASHVLLEAEVKLNMIVAQRGILEKEISVMNMIEANLEENIRILKRRRIVVIASDFRKSTQDIETARARRAFLRMDRENILKIEKHAELQYNKAKLNYEQAFEILHNPPNNVIQFRRRDGR